MSTPAFSPQPAVALHHQVKEDLLLRLRAGSWSPGSEIPPEPALCAHYRVSRGTLRRARQGPDMELLVASALGLVTACGVYLLLRPRSFSVVLGLSLLGYAVNGVIVVMGRLASGAPPIISKTAGEAAVYADPLPQALVLTAIVIGFATTGLASAMAVRSSQEAGSDHVDGQEAGR
mgnify:CR=1 FL=1